MEPDGIDSFESEGLHIAIRRTGAELISVRREGARGSVGFLYRDGECSAPSSGWANHATVMGYFLHRLWHEQSTYRGKMIHGGNHGFLRHFKFPAPRRIDCGLAYHVAAESIPPEAYPLPVSLDLTYRIENGALRVEFAFNNETGSDAHVSFGLHPGFAVTSLATAKVNLPAGTYTRFMAPGNFLDGTVERFDFAGGEMPFPKAGLPGSFLIGLAEVAERTIVLEDPGAGRRIEFDFSEVPYMTLWSDSDDYICIEPCWGLPDSNPPVAFEKKAGIQVIPAGETLRRGFSFRPLLIG